MRGAVGMLLGAWLGVLPPAASADPWALPEPGNCDPVRPASGDEPTPRFPSRTGDVVVPHELVQLRAFLPPELWEQRQLFFFEAMRLEIGDCFRRFAPPAFFREATRAQAGAAKIRSGGGLEGGAAGLPFDPASLDPDDPEVGQKWAWNAARRYQGAGRFGSIRLTYASNGSTQAGIEGDYFLALLMGRADLPGPDHRYSWARKKRWVSGGRTRDPSSGWRCAFRHFRGAGDDAGRGRSDDVFFLSSAMRKPERVGWDPEFPLLTCAYQRGYYLPRGGKVGRYRWRLVGVRDLLAPINARTPVHPADGARNFGPWGSSFASDRWDLRRVLILETGGDGRRVRRYLDLETLFPLYHVEGAERAAVVVQYVGRWSGDRSDYPAWPDRGDTPVDVIDPVAHVLVTGGGAEVVRVEAWDTVAVPPKGLKLRTLASSSALARGR